MFTLSLKISGNLEEFSKSALDRPPSYNDQDDDANSVIIDLCDILEETGIVRFRVGGFGQDTWPVDVAFDLASILEQLPEVIDSIYKKHYPFYLHFYEQGIQRQLVFEKTDKLLKISCYSGTSWEPSPSFISVNEEYVLSMLLNLKETFVQVVKKICPELSTSDLFTAWCSNHPSEVNGSG